MGNLEYSYFFMWGKRGCSYCQLTQELFFEKQLPHTIYFLDENPQLLTEVKQHFNWKTVPVIVEQRGDGSQEFIGGHSDFVKYLNDTNLD